MVLNGIGTRKATWFRIRVYHAGLYLESKSNSTEQILSDSGTKELRMRFLRDVSKEDMVDAWTDGFIKNAIDYSAIKDNVAIFTALMVDVKEGDTFAIQFKSNTVEIFYNDSFAGAVSDHEFARDVLAIWLGDHPPNESLKEGLLGKEE
ncbi:MAG: chalcone isomerase family protein [Bdellovibrionales bacterium]|nr:chalcone isomerase family protein [Bdellovibrionales bacterium]